MSIVQVSRVFKSYGPVEVLHDISFDVDQGDVVVLIGRSGSGKSTMLRCLNGLESIDSGSIRMLDHRLDQDQLHLRSLRQDVGIVFQQYNLFPHLTVERNITLALIVVKKMATDEARAITERVLRQVGLIDKIASYPEQLSGGQQQRVAIARSLAMAPKVMLFDEVTSALDPELKDEVLKVMKGLAEQGMTMLLVTHEMQFAREVANRLIFMQGGRIHEMGETKELFARPNTPELRQFISSTNV